MKTITDPDHPLAAVALAIEHEENKRGWSGGQPFTLFNLYREDDGFVFAKPIPHGSSRARLPEQLETVAETFRRDAALYRANFDAHPEHTLHGFMIAMEAWITPGTPEEVATGVPRIPPSQNPDRFECRIVTALNVQDQCARVWRQRRAGKHEAELSEATEWSGRVERLHRMIVRRQHWLLTGNVTV